MSEHSEQVALFNWAIMLESQIPQLKMIYAVPNGGHRHKLVAQKMKAEGVKAGVLDINLDVPITPYHGLRIEMKFGKNKPTENQLEWIERYQNYGYKTAICYDWETAARTILEYLRISPEGLI